MDNEQLTFNGLAAFYDGFIDGLTMEAYPFGYDEQGEMYWYFEGKARGKYEHAYPFGDNWAARQAFAKEQGEALQMVLDRANTETYLKHSLLFNFLRQIEKKLFLQLGSNVKSKGKDLKKIELQLYDLFDTIYEIRNKLEEKGLTPNELFMKRWGYFSGN